MRKVSRKHLNFDREQTSHLLLILYNFILLFGNFERLFFFFSALIEQNLVVDKASWSPLFTLNATSFVDE